MHSYQYIYLTFLRKLLEDMLYQNQGVGLFSTGSYIQYPVTNQNEKEYEKEYIYMYNWIILL